MQIEERILPVLPYRHTRAAVHPLLLLALSFCILTLSAAPATAATATATSVPRRALLVDKEVGLAVDPVGVVQSVELSSSISFNFFCEFVRPLLDEETYNNLPTHVCNGQKRKKK